MPDRKPYTTGHHELLQRHPNIQKSSVPYKYSTFVLVLHFFFCILCIFFPTQVNLHSMFSIGMSVSGYVRLQHFDCFFSFAMFAAMQRALVWFSKYWNPADHCIQYSETCCFRHQRGQCTHHFLLQNSQMFVRGASFHATPNIRGLGVRCAHVAPNLFLFTRPSPLGVYGSLCTPR